MSVLFHTSVLTGISPSPPDGAPCPMSPQWSKYRNSCYYLSKQSKTWSEARTHCQLMDGDLAIIETPEENHILEGWASSLINLK